MPNITTYYHGTSSKTTVTITSEEAFTEALASATNNILYYDPGEITVQWVLPNGEVVEGMSVDATVEEGTTVCICSDFYACGVDTNCDIIHVDTMDLPPFQGSIHLKGGMPHSLANYPVRGPIMGTIRNWIRGGLSVKGSETSPSKTYGTTKDIDNLLSTILKRLEISYAPHITGDLADIKEFAPGVNYNISDGTTGVRTYHPHFATPEDTTVTREESPTIISFHHCGVYGVPNISTGNMIFDWEYYACPNATPEDYDNFLEKLMTRHMGTQMATASSVGFVYANTFCQGYCYEVGKTIVPACGTLKISNRTANPTVRAEKLAILRAAGWQVTEVDDSLEDGIYAAL